MCISCSIRIEDIWLQFLNGQDYRTPDHEKGKRFAISEITPELIRITPQNITITKNSFTDALHYLRSNNHYQRTPCEIRSNDDPEKAGPLCRAARGSNSNTRCINYILPILRNFGYVGISGDTVNKAWLVIH